MEVAAARAPDAHASALRRPRPSVGRRSGSPGTSWISAASVRRCRSANPRRARLVAVKAKATPIRLNSSVAWRSIATAGCAANWPRLPRWK